MTDQLLDKNEIKVDDIENEVKTRSNPEIAARRKRIIIIVILSLLIIAVAVTLVIFLSSKSDNGKEEPPKPKPETSKTKILKEDKDFEKYGLDTGIYQAIELENGLKVILVSDKDTKNSGISLTVNSGSYLSLVPGLAHFCEHMFFGGSEKHPDYSEYYNLATQNGGKTNAYTIYNHTSFFFYVKNEAFEKITEIFASNAEKPLFKMDFVDREINNVNSEFLMYKNDPGRIAVAIYSENMNKKHSIYLNAFTCGNSESLNSVSHEELISMLNSYYNVYYRPENMDMIMYSNMTIDEMKKMAEKYFLFKRDPIKEEDKKKFEKFVQGFNEPISTKNELGKIMYFQGTANMIEIAINCYSPYIDGKDHPYYYLNYLIKSLKEGTLIEILRSRYMASIGFNLNMDLTFGVIEISISYLDIKTVPEIIQLVFYYIKKIAKTSISEEHFNAFKKLIESKNKFSESPAKSSIEEFIQSWSRNVRFLGIDKAIKLEKATNYNKEKIEELLKKFNGEESFIIICSNAPNDFELIQNMNLFDGDIIDKKLNYFETQYKYGNINKNTIEIEYPNDYFESLGLVIRDDNKYITEMNEYVKPCYEIDIKKCEKDEYIPEKKNLDAELFYSKEINETKVLNIFYQIDKSNHMPKNYITIYLDLPYSLKDKKKYIYNSLYFLILSDEIQSLAAEATESDNKISLSSNSNYNQTVTIESFSDKTNELFSNFFSIFFNPKMAEEKYNYYLQFIISSITMEKYTSKQITDKSFDFFKRIHLMDYFSFDFEEEDFSELNYEEFTQVVNDILHKVKMNMIIRGNIEKEEIQKIVDSILPYFDENTHIVYNSDYKPLILEEPKVVDFYFKHELSEQSFTLVTYEFNTSKYEQNMEEIFKAFIPSIFNTYIGNTYFNILRGEKGLGYGVSTDIITDGKMTYFMIYLMGNMKYPEEIEVEIDKVTKGILNKEIKISSDFETIKASLYKNKQTVSNNPLNKNSLFFTAYTYGGIENYFKIIDNSFKKITEDSVFEFMKEILIDNPYRLSILYYDKDADLAQIIKTLRENNTVYYLNKNLTIEYTNDLDYLRNKENDK